MQSVKVRTPYICTWCAQRLWRIGSLYTSRGGSRQYSQASGQQKVRTEDDEGAGGSTQASGRMPEMGAMSRRLEDMTEASVMEGGRGARKSMEDAGFSEELKEALLAKLEDGKFRSDNANAFAEVNMPVRQPLWSDALDLTDGT